MKVLGTCRKAGNDTVLLNVGNDIVDAFAVRVKECDVVVDDPVGFDVPGSIRIKGVPMKMEPL